jgi:hypothetical protein
VEQLLRLGGVSRAIRRDRELILDVRVERVGVPLRQLEIALEFVERVRRKGDVQVPEGEGRVCRDGLLEVRVSVDEPGQVELPLTREEWYRAAADEVVIGCLISALVMGSSADRPSCAVAAEYQPTDASTSVKPARADAKVRDCKLLDGSLAVRRRTAWRRPAS